MNKIAAIGRHGEQDDACPLQVALIHIKVPFGHWDYWLVQRQLNPERSKTLAKILETAGRIASYKDRLQPVSQTHGQAVKKKYPVMGALEEAQFGFPHIRNASLPALIKARTEGKSEQEALH